MSAARTEAALNGRMQPAAGPSELYRAYLKRLKVRRWLVVAIQVAILAVFLLFWEIAPRAHWVNPMLTSNPSAIWPTFIELLGGGGNAGDILHHTWVTVLETVVGFTVAMVLGIAISVMLWWSDFLYRVLDPFLVVANALPKIALVPIFYIWLGATLSIYGMAFAIAIFITVLMIYNGFKEIDPNKVKLVRTFGATKLQILQMTILPGSVPTMIAALKVNVGLTLVGVIVGEFHSAKAGLGYLIIYGSQIYDMDLVMSAITMLAVISTVMYLIISYFEGRITR
jgi:NitT/TauT family transport system permease protein